MIKFKNKKILIMGLGLHGGGLAITKYLAQKGARLTVTDLKTKEQLAPTLLKLKKYKINYVLGKHRLSDFRQADMIIQNPDVSRTSRYLKEAKKYQVSIENEASLFFKLCPAPIIAVTGTRGKSTTTSMIYEIIKRHNPKALMAGNIRTIVMFDIINKVKNNTPVILELSSWQLEGLASYKLSPHIGVFTNIMPDHLNRYKNYAEYINAKKTIYKYQTAQDYIVLNQDNQLTKKLGKEVLSQRYWFSKKTFTQENGAFVKKSIIYFRAKGKQIKICHIKNLNLNGSHNLENYLAAITAAKIYGVPNNTIIAAVRSYKGLANRQELIRTYKGIKYYNDTTATTPDATIAALNTLAESGEANIVLLAGGADKKLEFSELAKVIKNKAKALILFEGEATRKLVKELHKKNFNKTTVFADTMAEAFKQANYILAKGDIFILSPAAASFGLFINEFDRGDQFNKKVLKIK
jgi:UDP-N-acetylmuramoylalanine--D-glutamate ligase